ncbi:MAG: transcriptional regulator [Caloramator sp.]|jgi:predicted DNA-binding transcriptional regulator YafY|uniref:helix-turn-helix transcriptional regulator n=1 Tax=Caloramator sp. TaxID=1871330 RepID=UPI001DFF19B1|nr:WYL domain-containing protein [Caloramator sp.]MBZ4663739.1 transcriptional regulator [Caloramator sp.]
MRQRRDDESLGVIKSRILYFIITNPGKYSAEEIGDMFGFKKRRIQDFVKEFNELGYKITSTKGKYVVEKVPDNMVNIDYKLNYRDFKMATILEYLSKRSRFIKRKDFVDECSRVFEESPASIQSMIKQLISNGYIIEQNGKIKLAENPLDILTDDQLQILYIYLEVMKHFHYKGYVLDLIGEKIARRLNIEDTCIKVIPPRKRISYYDSFIVKEIEKAILNEKSLKIKYRFRTGIKDIVINPAGIIYSEDKDLYYLVEKENNYNMYRIDKITDIQVVDGGLSEFNKEDFKYNFGISIEKPFCVEIHFEKYPFIKRKLERYLKKKKTAQIIEEEKRYILKDTVVGFKEFKNWVKSFGKSAYVIEPIKLRDEIYKEIKETLERYDLNG